MARRCSEKKMFLKISQNSENACTSSVYQSLLLIKLQACNFIKKETLTRCFPGNCAKFLRTPFLTEHLWWLLLSKMWLTLQFSIFLVSSFIEDFLFISFQQENEIKREISWGRSNIYFFLEYRFVWRQIFQKKFDKW